jgi:hypothetical protein
MAFLGEPFTDEDKYGDDEPRASLPMKRWRWKEVHP